MRIALVQSSYVPDMETNLSNALLSMEEAITKGTDVICFPELQLSPFFPQYPDCDMSRYAIPINHAFIKKIRDKCLDLGLVAVPNFYLQEGEKRFDASPVINSNGKILGVSKMVHIGQLPQFYEKDYYTPSDSGFHVYNTSVGKIGIVICFDRHFPESIRTCSLKGAQLIIIPTANTKAEPLDMFEWELRVQAYQNGVFIAMCNRVGIEGDMHFCGESIVVNPDGDVITKADDTEQILFADLNFSEVEQAREKRPYLKLRRPEMYE